MKKPRLSLRAATISFTPHGEVIDWIPLDEHRRRLSRFNNLSLHRKNKIRQIRKTWRNKVRGDRD